MAEIKEIPNFSVYIAEALIGTCQDTGGYIEWYNEKFGTELTEDDLDWEIVENITFSCAGCGWWCEAGDQADINEMVCSECGEDFS